jgi:tRNA A-37 threonylcarbamoyl transferase component Bud32/tetratricopeptide (TPR) repeat protein
MSLAPGTRIGPYELVSRLGAGGMGEVYRARDTRLPREVALKFLSPKTLRDDSVDRFVREALLASSLNHPAIVTVYDVLETEDAGRCIAMELVAGATLRGLIREGVTFDRACDIGRQVAEALAVAHDAQIVHRDIKPENVMVRPDGYVKVLDFGLARVLPNQPDAETAAIATDTGIVHGTVGYMSPEQAEGSSALPASDVFALGVTLYELTAGRHPFPAASPLGVLRALATEQPEPPSWANPDLPDAFDQLVLEMLQKDARLRPTVVEVAARLKEFGTRVESGGVPVARRRTIASPASKGLVGREAEVQQLTEAFERARAGRGSLIGISGEAGMGKSALVDGFLADLQERDDAMRIARGRCSERLAGSEAYLPFLEALDSLQRGGGSTGGSVSRLLRTIAPSWYVQIATLPAGDSSAERIARDASGSSQERRKREMASLFEEIARLQTVVLVLDDVHWADPSTVDLLGYLSNRMDAMRLLMIATYEPSVLVQSRHPFQSLALDLQAHGRCRELTLDFLARPAIDRYLAHEFPEHEFPPAFSDLLFTKSHGHPLFLIDFLRDLRRRQMIAEVEGRWRLAAPLSAIEREVPESVRSLVRRKLDALDEDDRWMLVAASVQGMDFDTAVLSDVLEQPVEEIEERLERLEREHALVRFVEEREHVDRTLTLHYRFAQIAYQHALYESLRGTRRTILARSIADALTRHWGDRAPEIAATLAVLWEAARDEPRAAESLAVAAENAARKHAYDEAAQLTRHGLDLSSGVPDNASRAAIEMRLQMARGLALKTRLGYAAPEVGDAYRRVRELSQQSEDPSVTVPALLGTIAYHIVSGAIRTTYELSQDLVALAVRVGDPHLRMVGEWNVGAALFHLGNLVDGHAHLERALTIYDPPFHRARAAAVGIEPGIFCLCETSRTLCLFGRVDEARARTRQAVEDARSLGLPQALAFAMLFELLLHHECRDLQAVLDTYDTLAALCREKGIAQEVEWATPFAGFAKVFRGDERGLIDIARSLDAQAAMQANLLRPFRFLIQAEALLHTGRTGDAEVALARALETADATEQHAYDAEYHRVRAEWLLRVGRRSAEAEASFRMAIERARAQQARQLELRAALGISRLLSAQGRRADAEALLTPLLAWFAKP